MTIMQAIENIEMNNEVDEMVFIESFQMLIDSKIVWELQGSYGRMAAELIERGYCKLPQT
jgi:hypothetical protein